MHNAEAIAPALLSRVDKVRDMVASTIASRQN
jgi:hypothetical protein